MQEWSLLLCIIAAGVREISCCDETVQNCSVLSTCPVAISKPLDDSGQVDKTERIFSTISTCNHFVSHKKTRHVISCDVRTKICPLDSCPLWTGSLSMALSYHTPKPLFIIMNQEVVAASKTPVIAKITRKISHTLVPKNMALDHHLQQRY